MKWTRKIFAKVLGCGSVNYRGAGGLLLGVPFYYQATMANAAQFY